MINVYVAGVSRNKERARAFMDRVRAHPGMSLAIDWVEHIDAADADGKRDQDFDHEARKAYAEADLNALASSDVAVFLAESDPVGRGLWVELGYAICLRESDGDLLRGMIVSGGEGRSIFTSLADAEVSYAVGEHDAEAFALLEGYA